MRHLLNPHRQQTNNDLYQFTMAQGYLSSGRKDDRAAFHLFFRENPFDGGYVIAAGLGSIVEYLQQAFDYSDEQLEYLSSIRQNGEPIFEDAFIDYLDDLEFECDVHAVPEGEPVFPHEPIVRVKGPIIQAQLVETPLLNLLNYQSLVATKAARIREASSGQPVLEFGLRRAQGPDGGLSAARGAYIGGADGTSNVRAGQRLDIPVKGTHSHSWVQSFATEKDAFRAFADSQPNNCVFLVDTYDTLRGVDRAIEVADEKGLDSFGIRLDSGDLAWLSRQARKKLEEAGYPGAMIVASNGLEENTVKSLEDQGHEIDAFGIGTNLVTCKGDPSLGGVYKLGAVRGAGHSLWSGRMKLSERRIKRSIPGCLNVLRFEKSGEYRGDMIYNSDPCHQIGTPSHEELESSRMIDPMDPGRSHQPPGRGYRLLKTMFKDGQFEEGSGGSRLWRDLDQARDHRAAQMDKLHSGIRRFRNPHEYPVGIEESLHEVREEIVKEKS